MATVELTVLRRSRARHIDLFAGGRTVGRGQLESFRVDEDRLYSLGHRELFNVAVGRQRRRANHEVSPDGRNGRATS
jgi:hypothetical protein